MHLYLVRHGQSEGNARGVLQGRLDFGLSELGRRQAEATAARLLSERVDRVVSSPLLRAAQTAEAISAALGLPVEPEPALQEYDVGDVSGLTGPEIRERFPEVRAAYARGERPRFPGEEGRDVFNARVTSFLARHRDGDETIVAIAHGGVVSELCYLVLGVDGGRRGLFEVANCSITEVRRDRAGRLVLQRHNDVCHLDGLITRTDRG